MKFVELHVVQNLPPSALNRDDTGRPKAVVWGGVERVRISSQAQKRATRLLFRELALVPEEERAVRTRRVEALLEGALGGLKEEERKPLLKALFQALGLKLKEEKGALLSEYLLFLGEKEARALAEAALRHKEALLAFAKAREEAEDKKKRKAGSGELPKEALEDLKRAFGVSLEVALFGRMIADLEDQGMDGALSVAHAVGTTADPVDEDYFTALDDLVRGQGAAGMIEARGFAAGTVYRYAVLDLGELSDLVGKERALLGAKALLKAFPLALPGGARRAFAHYGEPEFVLVRVGEGLPRNLAKAFARPVEANGEDPALASARRLLAYMDRLDRVYGKPRSEGLGAVSLFDEPLPVPLYEGFDRLTEEVLGWAERLL
uniref:Type I-E CRISPR-associated protein Cas7/Cse4/CasC n=1 Tax=Thermus tengchongensis TaxID=1214928 RepID=A0A7V4ANL8_9DEIN